LAKRDAARLPGRRRHRSGRPSPGRGSPPSSPEPTDGRERPTSPTDPGLGHLAPRAGSRRPRSRPLLIPGSTTLFSPGAIFVFHLHGILLARDPGRSLPETRLRRQRDSKIQDLLPRIGGADRPEPLPLVPDPSLSAHQRLRLEALAPPKRVHDKIALRHPGIVAFLGIETQEIRLLAPHLDDATWLDTPIS